MVLLESSRPDLARGLEKRWGQECVAYVAARLSKTLGAERKLLRFLAEFVPDAPAVRPASHRQVWNAPDLEQSLRLVYRFRSEYLHAGTPLPWELCIAPEPDDSAPCERVPDLLAARDEGVRQDLPMRLHVFEHIVRGALVAWWRRAAS